MVSGEFKVGDLVWAKMKSYPPWPAKIEEPNPKIKQPSKNKKSHFVFFFGTENFAWIPDDNIRPHSEDLLKDSLSKKKSGAFRAAIDAFVSYVDKQGSPLKPKKTKVQREGKDSQTKVVKIVNSASKKRERKVLTHKSSVKASKKSSFYDVNGEHSGTYSPSKSYHEVHSDDTSLSSSSKSLMADFPDWDGSAKISVSPNPFLDRKHVVASKTKFGFIGLGRMGSAIVKNMLLSGHDVTVWNRSRYKISAVKALGAKEAESPAALMIECDVTFCCVADAEASKSLIFSEQGILKGLDQASTSGMTYRGYVEMTTMDPESSLSVSEAVSRRQGLYLEAPLCGTTRDAQDGTLLIVASGDRRVFSKCETCFHAIGKHAFFLTCEIGRSSKMAALLNTLSGTMCIAVAEAMVLGERLNMTRETFINLLEFAPLSCEGVINAIDMVRHNDVKTYTSLKSILNDLNHAMKLSHENCQPMAVTAASSEVFKFSRCSKVEDKDSTALYKSLQSM